MGLLKIRPAYKEALSRHFDYYKKLPARDKVIFERRVQFFINLKQFIPRGIPEVTSEMKALIAASAIQLTFGLPRVYFSHFSKILIYPDDYYSTITRKYHKGEVNPGGGLIVLSWKNFVYGYINSKDSVNLGLHEMAHALRLENRIMKNEYNFLDEETLKKWDTLALKEMNKIAAENETIFRGYAVTNKHEFFAVAVEGFFERPRVFYDYNAELYRTMAKLLKQDTLQLYNS